MWVRMMTFRRPPAKSVADAIFDLVKALFAAGAATCALMALHRIAAGIKIGARVQVLQEMGEAFTEEEREVVVRKIKSRTLSGL
jgi:hypothetical protein